MLRRRWRAASAMLAATAFLAAACTGTVSAGGSGSGGSSSSGNQPHRGGTLTMLGQSDIFNLDTVSAYYTVSSMLERMFTRQLFSYGDPTGVGDPAARGARRRHHDPHGGQRRHHRRRQDDHHSHPPGRQVGHHARPGRSRAADFVREFKMLCNPSSPVGAPGYFTNTIVGMAAYCTGFAKAPATVAGDRVVRELAQPARRGRDERLDADLPPAQLDAGLPVHPDHGLLLGPPGRVHEVRARQRHLPPAHDLRRPVPDHFVLGGQVVHPGAQPGLVGRVRPAPARLR